MRTWAGGATRGMAASIMLFCMVFLGGCSGGAATTAKAGQPKADIAGSQDVAPAGDVSATTDAKGPAADAAAAKLALLGVSPAQGKSSGGTTVTLTGTGFADGMQVLVGGTPMDGSAVFVLDATSAQVQMPPHDTGLVDLTVAVPGPGPKDPAITSKLPGAYLYFNDLVLTAIEPAKGPVTGGTPITIKGTGFLGKTSVLIGGKPAIGVKVVADDELIAVTPPGLFGAAPVHVVNERGAGLMKKGFFYFAAPTIASLSPAAGPTAGGTAVTVTGTGFTSDTDIAFGLAKASVLEVVSDKVLKIATPPGPEGKTTVLATTPYGTGSLAGGYVYSDDQGQAATKILSIAPAKGPLGGGPAVTIIATGLVSASDTTVLFGNKSAMLLSVSAAAHTAVVQPPAASAAGAVDVVLMTSKGTDKAISGYFYSDSLELASITPPVGPPDGGTAIVVKGTGFSKGKPALRIGALPAASITVVSDSEIHAFTPPGSSGYVDVSIAVGEDKAVLPSGFAYSGKNLEIFVPYPNTGAQAGGTLIHVYGNGFAPVMAVTFGGKPATHFTFIDPSHVTCKTPPGKVGAVDVGVQVGSASALLPSGFTYFNPMSQYGGTWGAPIDGSVNLTVIDGTTAKPVADAFTMLWTDPATPYQGYTNADGQITFSGPDVVGKQMVSASKEGYESSSIVLFNATNATVMMSPTPPPTPGSPPPGDPPPDVIGKVIGLDKYVFVPVGDCTPGTGPAPTCNYCTTDAQCGGTGFACVDVGTSGKHCVADCSLGQACPATFKCMPQTGGGARCLPSKGDLTAVCYHSKDNIFAQDSKPAEGAGFEANATNDYNFKITTGYGEMAVVCFGGYKSFGAQLTAGDTTAMQAFTATSMGIARHVMVSPGEKLTPLQIKLDMPLIQKAAVRLDNPPVWSPSATIATATWAHLVLGSDGVIRMPFQDFKIIAPYSDPNPDQLVIQQLPAAFSGEIADASLSIIGLVVQIDGAVQLPLSLTVKNDIHQLSNDAMVRRVGDGDFESVDTGVKKNIYGMWGTAANNLYAVGAQGTLVHWDGGGWSLQAGFATQDLTAVHGIDAQHVWAVGLGGAAGAFDGIAWKPTPVLAGNVTLSGVFAAQGPSGPEVWATGQSGVYKLGAAGWQKYNPSPYLTGMAIHGSDKDHIWTVGMTGQIMMWDGQLWKLQVSGTSIALRGVWAAGPKSVYAVGEKGQILHYDGTAWSGMPSPVKATLQAVYGTSDADVWAVGVKGLILHWDGQKWQKIALTDVDKSLSALWLDAAGDFFSLGEQELLLGPLLDAPVDVMPTNGGQLVGNTLKWKVDPSTVEPHFNYVTIGIPGMGPDTPVWNIMTKGSISEVELPDFPMIQGTPGIPKGTQLRLTIIRGYKEGFDINAYDGTDLNQLTWRSWSMNSFMFTKP